jgi:ribonuclease HI
MISISSFLNSAKFPVFSLIPLKQAVPGHILIALSQRINPIFAIVMLFTDGGCINNPGPGGYGVVMICRGHRKEFSGGFRRTTNNRMELLACIKGLEALRFRCRVSLCSDSRYVVNGIKKGWAKRWRSRGWKRTETEAAENADLWSELLDLCEKHSVDFTWIKGHAGHPENEQCDVLAKAAATQKGLPQDTAYEAGKTQWAQ